MNHAKMSFPLFLLLISCGKPIQSELPKERKIYQTYASNSPLFLEKQTRDCNFKRFNKSQSIISLNLFLNGQNEYAKKDLSPLLTGLFLRDREVIANSYYGEKSENILERGRTISYLNSRPIEISLCPDEEYKNNSVEGAALSASYYIHKTNLRFSFLIPEVTVPPVILNIAPSILLRTLSPVQETKFMTDNAYYRPSDKSITFLPHSSEMKLLGLSVNFWEVPMVASHEYGHHLFHSLYQMNNTKNVIHSCFGETATRTETTLKSMAYRKVSKADVMNAYNEGFSDLVSFYLLDTEERSVKGVKCLEETRDVTSSVFYNGEEKAFNSLTLDSFFSNFSSLNHGPCEDPHYQSPHILGAVFAYSADSVLSLLTDSNDEKFKTVVEWIRYLNTHKKKYKTHSSRQFLEESFADFIRLSVKKFDFKLNRSLCKKITTIAPKIPLAECSP